MKVCLHYETFFKLMKVCLHYETFFKLMKVCLHYETFFKLMKVCLPYTFATCTTVTFIVKLNFKSHLRGCFYEINFIFVDGKHQSDLVSLISTNA